MGVIEGGSRAYMAAYNAMNEVPMTVNPVLENVTRKEMGKRWNYLYRCWRDDKSCDGKQVFT